MSLSGEVDLIKKNTVTSKKNSKVGVSRPARKKFSALSRKALKKYINRSIFSRAYAFPSGVEIDGQEPKEKVVFLFRQHPVVLLSKVFITLLIALAAISLLAVASILGVKINGFIVSLSIWLMLLSGTSFLYTVIYWFYNLNIVTSNRILDMDFDGVAVHKVSETPLENIEDVSHVHAGFFSNMFDFGTIYVQTAAEKREFEFQNVPDPRRIQDIILDMVNAKKSGVKI